MPNPSSDNLLEPPPLVIRNLTGASRLAQQRALCDRLRRQVTACLAEAEAQGTSVAGATGAWLRGLSEAAGEAATAAVDDLDLARRLVDTLIPAPLPEARNVDVAARVERCPAVGGNAALAIPVDAGRLVVVVLDASGQGLPVASLTAWAAVELTRLVLWGVHSPRALLERLNRALLKDGTERYLRAFAADLDLDLMEMTYVNASHCEPLRLRAGRIESVDTQGLFVGLFEDANYEERSLRLAEGEMLLFYSDAVVDALRDRAGLVEPAGLLSMVGARRYESAAALVDALAREVLASRWEHPDDMVLLALRCRHVEDWHAVVIPSDPREAKRISDTILERLTLGGWAENDLFAVKLGLEEAVTNAIRHGNKGDPTKRVHVRYSLCSDRVVIIIGDEGPGFDPSMVPDPTAPDRLEVPTGRGIMLMRAYLTSVDYNAQGNQVKLMRLRHPAGAPGRDAEGQRGAH